MTENDFKRAAAVFNFKIPDWLEDDAVVGKIVGTAIHAGEVRRLSQALEAVEVLKDTNDQHIEALLREDQFINAIKYRRQVTGEGLKQAKDYVEALGVNLGILYRTREGFIKRTEE